MSVIVALLDGNGITTMTRTVVRTAPRPASPTGDVPGA